MNIRRGFFRLWLVLSAVFVAAVLASSFSSLKTAFEKAGTVDITLPNGTQIDNIPANMDPNELRQKIIKNGIIAPDKIVVEKTGPWDNYKSADAPYNLVLDLQDKKPAPSAWPKFFGTLLFAFGVPLGVLLGAHLFVWIVSGFKSSSANIAGTQ